MMNLILSSDFPITENKEITDFIKNHYKKPKIACIPPEIREAQDRFPTIQGLFERFGFTDLTLFTTHFNQGNQNLTISNLHAEFLLLAGKATYL